MQYVNYHGTSTELNDRIETRAMKLAFGNMRALGGIVAEEPDRSSTGRLRIGRDRGHSARDARRRGAPTINLECPDPECDLDYIADGAAKDEHRIRRGATASRSGARTARWC